MSRDIRLCTAAVTCAGLEVVYADGTHALRGLDLTIEVGERVVLLGANGSGKSTLLRCAVGLIRPTRGTISMLGERIEVARASRLRSIRRRVGVVFQRFDLVPGLTAFQNVLWGALGRRSVVSLTRLTAPVSERQLAMAALDRVGLADRAASRVDRLSGGQQQRVAIARVIMQDPEVILADEPVASLDPRAGRAAMELLFEVAQERKLTVVCALHQLDLAKDFGDRIVALAHGRTALDAPTASVDAATLGALYDGDRPEHADQAPPRRGLSR